MKKSTINWRVYKLVDQGVLERIGRGIFRFGETKEFTPELTASLKTLYRNIHNTFPYVELCIWNTAILNEFMLHQPFKFLTLVEVEKDVLNSVFQHLKESKTQVFLNPNREVLQHYLSDQRDAIIVKPLVSESPLLKVGKVITPTLEKVLVDIICDKDLFSTFQGSEMRRIFQEAFKQYTINERRLLRYANRRKRKEELKNFLVDLQLLALNE